MAVVLVVEDDEQVRVLAEAFLQENSHKTLSASTAEEAIALLDGSDPIDLIFTDIALQEELRS